MDACLGDGRLRRFRNEREAAAAVLLHAGLVGLLIIIRLIIGSHESCDPVILWARIAVLDASSRVARCVGVCLPQAIQVGTQMWVIAPKIAVVENHNIRY